MLRFGLTITVANLSENNFCTLFRRINTVVRPPDGAFVTEITCCESFGSSRERHHTTNANTDATYLCCFLRGGWTSSYSSMINPLPTGGSYESLRSRQAEMASRQSSTSGKIPSVTSRLHIARLMLFLFRGSRISFAFCAL